MKDVVKVSFCNDSTLVEIIATCDDIWNCHPKFPSLYRQSIVCAPMLDAAEGSLNTFSEHPQTPSYYLRKCTLLENLVQK